MPELPEVETIVRDLRQSIIGATIEKVVIYDHRVIKVLNPQRFCRVLTGCTITEVSRKGKLIILHFSNGHYLTVHLKMTGQLIISSKKDVLKETKVLFLLSNQRCLHYNDQRLFGRLHYVKDLGTIDLLKRLGPDPFLDDTFEVQRIYQKLKTRTIPIKTLLLNQDFIAGIGNIYASEILFDARINPRKSARRLTKKEVQALHASTRSILQEAIDCRGTSMRNYRDASGQKGQYSNRIRVYGRAHEACLSCHSTIQKIVQHGRSTFFCQQCQG